LTLGPPPPAPRTATLRQQLLDYLQSHSPASLRDLSVELGLSEKVIPDHLEHLHKSLRCQGLALEILPAQCLDCGFTFRDRHRMTPPGRCPACRSSHLSETRFSLSETSRHGKHRAQTPHG